MWVEKKDRYGRGRQYAKTIKGITPWAQVVLSRYPWPGNIRELKSALGSACMMAEGEMIDVRDLPERLRARAAEVRNASGVPKCCCRWFSLHRGFWLKTARRDATALDDAALADLAQHFRGELIRPGDTQYAARAICNRANRSSSPARRALQPSAEFAELVRDTIGELVVGPGPYVLGWIELGRVRREVVSVKSGMVGQERTNLATSMDELRDWVGDDYGLHALASSPGLTRLGPGPVNKYSG